MNVVRTAAQAAAELSNVLSRIDEESVQTLIESALKARKVFFTGCGRSLLALRGIAMRFMHIGLQVHVVGDVTTPAFTGSDLLIVGSGSGETSSQINFATKAKSTGGKVALITTKPQSTMADLSDFLVVIPAMVERAGGKELAPPTLPGGTLFEESMLVLGDAMILDMAEKKAFEVGERFPLHANLE